MRIIFQGLTTAMGWLGWLVALSWVVVTFGDSLYFLSFVVALVAFAGAVFHSTRRNLATRTKRKKSRAYFAAVRRCLERAPDAAGRRACLDRFAYPRGSDGGVPAGSGGDGRE